MSFSLEAAWAAELTAGNAVLIRQHIKPQSCEADVNEEEALGLSAQESLKKANEYECDRAESLQNSISGSSYEYEVAVIFYADISERTKMTCT
ncbi:hypothetical protein Q7C36_022430 [Tachysurus vachellii]|uniref:Uncharacterized protein n=1 Tax=Tachysurus vachellii TaxID=175792 RepID=A0AA88J074_TACVA|nr:hypothetical protein Q7C36_022430 [Tachysurus vachellii]